MELADGCHNSLHAPHFHNQVIVIRQDAPGVNRHRDWLNRLQEATLALGHALFTIGGEARGTIRIAVSRPEDALNLLLNPNALKATLRC